MADLAQLRDQLRLGLALILTIVFPGLILAWSGFSALKSEELAVVAEEVGHGESTIATLSAQVEQMFSEFETEVRQRLESGRSPVDNPGELSPYLLVAFRLDASGQLAAPFQRRRIEPLQDQTLVLSPAWRAALAAEQDPAHRAEAPGLYRAIRQSSRGLQSKGQATFAEGRALMRIGKNDEAAQLFADVVADYGSVRDVNGFRLGDLARLKRGEAVLQQEPEIGAQTLEALVEELLTTPWTIGFGGEAAVAARALELLEDHSEKDWLAWARGRLEVRTRQLFHAERLNGELDRFTAGGKVLRVATGEPTYTLAGDTLWATLWSGEDLYAFALDANAIRTRISELATITSLGEDQLVARLVAQDDAAPSDAIARRTLAPYFPGWSMGIYPRDPDRLARLKLRKRFERAVVVVLALLMIVAGAIAIIRLVGRQVELAREKTEFAANVSHELRSPITQIRLKGEALQLGLFEDEEEFQEAYTAIVRESERLSRLVDNVLDFSAIERGAKRYSMRPGDLSETVRAAVQSARYSAETRGLEMDLELPDDMPMVMHDPEAISQVMQNLISNAAKYGKEGGWIGVTAHTSRDAVYVKVKDRGIGIQPGDLSLIFERYYRSPDPEARRRKGTGIGLTIVKYIMEAHDGHISVTSTPGQGTTFTLHFPIAPRRRTA